MKDSLPINICSICMSDKQGKPCCPVCGSGEGAETVKLRSYLPSGLKLAARYILGAVVCEDVTGITYVAYDLHDNKRVHIKCAVTKSMRIDFTTVFRYPDKLNTLVTNRIDNIKGTVGINAWIDSFIYDDMLFMVCDAPIGITLRELVEKSGNLNYALACNILGQVMKVIATLHRKKLLHGCISPDYVQVFKTIDGKLSVSLAPSDFVAAFYSNKPAKFLNPVYAPCEFDDSDEKPTTAVDVYSAASLFYYMLSGSEIPTSSDREYDETIIYPKSITSQLSRSQRDALTNALAVYPDDRTESIVEFAHGMGIELIAPAAVSDSVDGYNFKTVSEIICNCDCDDDDNDNELEDDIAPDVTETVLYQPKSKTDELKSDYTEHDEPEEEIAHDAFGAANHDNTAERFAINELNSAVQSFSEAVKSPEYVQAAEKIDNSEQAASLRSGVKLPQKPKQENSDNGNQNSRVRSGSSSDSRAKKAQSTSNSGKNSRNNADTAKGLSAKDLKTLNQGHGRSSPWGPLIFFILLGAILVTIIVLLLTGKDNSDTPSGLSEQNTLVCCDTVSD